MPKEKGTPCVWRGQPFISFKTAAEYLGAHTMTVSRHHRLYGNLDAIPPRGERRNSDVRYQLKRRGIKMGGFHGEFLLTLRPEVRDWVVDTIPNGVTVGEYLRSMVNDAYDQDQPEKETDQ